MGQASSTGDVKQRIQMDGRTKEHLRSPGGVPNEIIVGGRKYYPHECKGEGYKGVVWRGKDQYGADVAIKFTVFADYLERSYLEEASCARSLGNSEYFARFLDAGVVDMAMADGERRRFVVFVEDWVNGRTLAEYVSLHGASPEFLLSYVRSMSGALGVLANKGYQHDDLHPENVMIARPEEGDVVQEARVKVIDTGSMKPLSRLTKKDKDDYAWFAEHVLLIRNVLRRPIPHRPLSLFESRFIREIDPLLDRMFEEDRVSALWAPGRVYTEFESASSRALAPEESSTTRLNNPFDYIAAEHIASDELLVNLFADACPWFAEVAGPNPLLLTGPRGCGKSTVFRRLSLKALLHKSPNEIGESTIAGFYVSCSSDLRNRLGWIEDSDTATKRFRNEVVHYFNLLILREIVQTLSLICDRDDRETLFGFGDAEEIQLHEYLMAQLQVSDADQLRLQGMRRMQHALALVEQKMDECYRAMRMGVTVSHATGVSFLADLTRFLSGRVAYFGGRPVALLIDDYSVHRLGKPVQLILNDVLWDRQRTYISKVSAEKFGAEGIDELRLVSELGRELREFDCGRYYLDAKKKSTRHFAKQLLAIRLRLAGYEGTPDGLVGPSKYPKGGLGGALRARQSEAGRNDWQYHGLATIADMCSGDVSVLLEIYRRIFEYGSVTSKTTDRVKAHDQHAAISDVSRDLVELIKNYVPYGPEMYKLVTSFGWLSNQILRHAPFQKKGSSEVVPQTTRIEVDQPPGQCADLPDEPEVNLLDELVRRAVFIEMAPGRSRHQLTTCLRLQLRLVYCPMFGTSIYKNTAVKFTMDEFKYFLLNPPGVCKSEFAKRWARSRDDQKAGQLSLFGSGTEPQSIGERQG